MALNTNIQEKFDDLGRVIKSTELTPYSQIDTYYKYHDSDVVPSVIETHWDDFSHKIRQLHIQYFGILDGKYDVIKETITYYDGNQEIETFNYTY